MSLLLWLLNWVEREQALADGAAGVEPSADATPEKEFERRWAETLLERVLERCQSAPKEHLLEKCSYRAESTSGACIM